MRDRNLLFFEEDLDAQLRARQYLRIDLRHGRRRGHACLHLIWIDRRGGVVGALDQLVHVLERDRGDDGTEDLLLRDAHVVLHAREHRRRDEEAALARGCVTRKEEGSAVRNSYRRAEMAVMKHETPARRPLARRHFADEYDVQQRR